MDLLPNKRIFTKPFGVLILIMQIPTVAFAGSAKISLSGGLQTDWRTERCWTWELSNWKSIFLS